MGGRNSGKPLIGITTGPEGETLVIKRYYADAVYGAGGCSVLIPSENSPHRMAEIIDGLLIPGGQDLDPSYFSEPPHPSITVTPRERSDFEILLLNAIMEAGKPVFGICYGMQLINVALGGTLYQDIGSQVHTMTDHRKGRHEIHGEKRFFSGTFMVNTAHHQAVRELGAGLEVGAVAGDSLIEAIIGSGYPFLLGVQWHPERQGDALSSSLFRSFVESAHAGK